MPLLDSGIQLVKSLDTVIKPEESRIRAFTLVEMSIVLIIIGLIVAGIAKGQSMIHSAKVMSVVSFIEQKKVAIRTFEMKYDALPGDMNNAWDYWGTNCAANYWSCNGDGDFKIERSAESHQVWKHLYLAGLIDENLTGVTGSQESEPGINIPESEIEGVGISLYQLLTYGITEPKNRFLLGRVHPTSSNINIGAAFLPADAHSIDKKMDDGVPTSGKVQGGIGKDLSGANSYCYDGVVYRLSVDELRCVMIIELD